MRFLVIMVVILVACVRPPLVVEQHNVHADYLMSTQLHTPDAQEPIFGHELFVHWRLTDPIDMKESLPKIHLTIRYKDKSQEIIEKEVSEPMGTFVFQLVGKEYEKHGGIETYKAELLQGQAQLFSWQHQIWTERIESEIDAMR